MQSHGVEAVDCFAVDNALIKLADPLFLGHCHSHQTDCGALVRPVRFIYNFCTTSSCIYWVDVLDRVATEYCIAGLCLKQF